MHARSAIFFAIAAIAYAQTEGPLPSFEAASLKLSSPTDRMIGMLTYPGGRITARNYTAEMLLCDAFDIESLQIKGGPEWIRDLRFNIDAKPPLTSKSSKSKPASIKLPPNDEQRLMLRQLLVDRFQLKYRKVASEAPIYALITNGKRLRLQPPKDLAGFPWVGDAAGGAINGGGLAGENAPMQLLARRLSKYMGRPVEDRTGLTGPFDFRFAYVVGDPAPDIPTVILTSLRALGLNLQPTRGTVETIEIIAIEKPSEN